MFLMLKGVVENRSFIKATVKSEIKNRYSKSTLGNLWLILHPLAQAGVLALVLSQIVGSRIEGIESDYAYVIYLLSGMVSWNLFSETTASSVTMFRDRANIIKKINFPKVCIPVIVVATSLINHFLFFLVVILIIWFLGVAPGILIVYLPIYLILILLFSVGIGLILAVFDVFNRDISNIWQVLVQFWFWLTPIVYTADGIDGTVAYLLSFNPMLHVVEGYHSILAYKTIPAIENIVGLFFLSLLLLFVGFTLFVKGSADIVDEL
jgi:lipopolysaccharide transport system permease protein